jgi:hypothetical protein
MTVATTSVGTQPSAQIYSVTSGAITKFLVSTESGARAIIY